MGRWIFKNSNLAIGCSGEAQKIIDFFKQLLIYRRFFPPPSYVALVTSHTIISPYSRYFDNILTIFSIFLPTDNRWLISVRPPLISNISTKKTNFLNTVYTLSSKSLNFVKLYTSRHCYYVQPSSSRYLLIV